MAGWLIAVCFVAVLVALAARGGTGRKRRRTRGPLWRAGRLARGATLARRWLRRPSRRFAVWYWRPLAVFALVVPASALFDASGGGAGGPNPASSAALEASDSRSQGEGNAGVRKKRHPDLVALQWSPTSQPSSEPRQSTASPSVEPASPPLPLVLPPPIAPDEAISGLSTWYGGIDGFGPEDIMADGSNFNPDDPTITAANRWPLGTWLRVCLDGRCIGVQVRDTGAFSHALDLSHAAFRQLAAPSTGVISVSILKLN